MRIRDCSSDVCASDLSVVRPSIEGHQGGKVQPGSHLSLPHFFEAAAVVVPPAFGFLSSAGFSLTSSLTAGLLPTSSSRLSRSACVMNSVTWTSFVSPGETVWPPNTSWTRNCPVVFTVTRSEEHTSELQSLMRISYAVFCLKKKK